MPLPEYIGCHFLHVLSKSWNVILTRLLAAILIVRHARYFLGGIHFLCLVFRFDFAVLLAINVNDVNVESNVLQLQKFLLSLLVQVKLLVVLALVLIPVPSVSFESVEQVVICLDTVFICVK